MALAVTRYCLVSLPVLESAAATWAALQQGISRVAFDTPTYKFNIPELRIGTLDALMVLSDDLVKINGVVEGVTHKIRRQIEDLDHHAGVEASALTVDGVPVDTYITKFTWDEAKYPLMNPLRETADMIQDNVSKHEDDLKIRVAEYTNVKTQLSAINRRQTGSMAARDISNLVKPSDVISTEHLVTLVVVVSKFSQNEWLKSYESLTDFVVPRSSAKLHEDNEYALYTVILFRKVADNFKSAARERGFQVRDIEFDPEGQQQRRQEQDKLSRELDSLRSSLQQWCCASYGEVFSAWMHICAIRIFAESILRYGLPPKFLAAVMAPSQRNEKKVRSMLEGLCNAPNSGFWKSDEDGGGVAGIVGGEVEAHPYVSFTLNLAG
ncbi:hypothetical protein SELMODRAFT_111716 [Selaginella moellendorffii]|uniref:V-type proton ATPase subunit C n=1 Tax=Selaginella moellendorffii TaxID=88036 RepID=D8S9Y0_SELML|nr:V-type proton ATPase subunit C [Selaginella moellendorffii]EFJ05989.1 hypothetical protein SELMODRAFT_187073 [Selaginella moellendorffii]EFJ19030.1 hypothetical protein SELMODRAFT_111716 [Selaginella moellendorffii]|eukprot:XP_002980160.1 V-type proton ATPase subunit C [Selaginella moellendorffii]